MDSRQLNAFSIGWSKYLLCFTFTFIVSEFVAAAGLRWMTVGPWIFKSLSWTYSGSVECVFWGRTGPWVWFDWIFNQHHRQTATIDVSRDTGAGNESVAERGQIVVGYFRGQNFMVRIVVEGFYLLGFLFFGCSSRASSRGELEDNGDLEETWEWLGHNSGMADFSPFSNVSLLSFFEFANSLWTLQKNLAIGNFKDP